MSSTYRYTFPDTSDKLEEESWLQYWDRKRIERHGTECNCNVCALARMGIGDEPLPGLPGQGSGDGAEVRALPEDG